MSTSLPISTLELFPILDEKLVRLLSSFDAEDWQRPTISPRWCVKDIAAHLLDGNIRGLSLSRDHYAGDPPDPLEGFGDLVAYLDRLNAEWVQACRRISPEVLITLLDHTGRQYYEHLCSLDPFAPALFPVAWAGEEQSPNWFHIAREYTEKWHHQQQIRLAAGKEEELLAPDLFLPFLETSMRALPHHYRTLEAPAGTVIQVVVTGAGGKSWYLARTPAGWALNAAAEEAPAAEIRIDGTLAWRILTKGISREEARRQVTIRGKEKLAEHVLTMRAVMA